jgi:hypothetical protein
MYDLDEQRSRLRTRQLAGAGRQEIGISQALIYLQAAPSPVTSFEVQVHSHMAQPAVSILLSTLLALGLVKRESGGFREPATWTWL